MKRILITGANSYLGKSLTEYLKQWPDEFQVEATSVRDDTWKETDFHFFDAIYHTAALVHMEQNKQDPAQAEFYDRVNARLPIFIAKKAKAEAEKTAKEGSKDVAAEDNRPAQQPQWVA